MVNNYLKFMSLSLMISGAAAVQAQSLVKDINSGTNGCQQGEVVKVGANVLFRANDQSPSTPDFELWVTDGTASGTVKKSINSGISGFPKNGKAISSNTKFVFNGTGTGTGAEMFIYNVSSGVVSSVIDIYSGTTGSNPDGFTEIPGSTDFVFGATISSGTKLHKSTVGGVVSSLAASSVSNPANFEASGSWVFFAGDDGTNGTELWKTNGVTTSMVKDIKTSGSSFPDNLTDVNGVLYFTADDGVNGNEVWKSDGTSAGTVMLKNLNTTSNTGSNPTQLTAVGSKLFFVADDGSTGNELWYSDGTASGTQVENIYPNSTSSNPTDLVKVGDLLFFAATRPAEGNEVFYFDPSSNTLHLAANVDGAATNSSPQYLTNAYGDLYFSATTAANGREVYKWTNGSTATRMTDINSGAADASPKDFRVVGSDIVFFADNGSSGAELWSLGLSNAPTISPISTKTVNENQASSFNVTIGSSTSASASLTLSGLAADTTLIGANSYSFSGTGSTRSVTINPKSYQNGTTTITLKVCDISNNCVSTGFTFTVIDINNPPVVSVVPKSVNEDVTLSFLTGDFINKFTDADGTVLDSISITSLPADGVLLKGTDTIKNADLPLKLLTSVITTVKYHAVENWNGSTSFGWNAFSGGFWGTLTSTVNITVNAINDLPTITKSSQTVNEDLELTFASANFDGSPNSNNYADVEGSALASIKVTYLPPNGILTYNGDTLNSTTLPKTILTANIGNLKYKGDLNFFGADFFFYQAGDGSGFSTADSLNVQVQAVNDLPTVSSFNVSFNEDQIFSFSKSGFDTIYSDIETATLNKVKFTSLPLNGTLNKSSVAINVNDELTRKQLDSLTFVPDANFNGATTFQYQVSDGVGYSTSTGIANITVVAVNDAPVVDMVTKSGNEDTDITFASTDFSAQYSDIESDGLQGIQVITLPVNGTLKLSSTPITSPDLPYDVIIGSLSNLIFTPNADWNGSTIFTWKANDGNKYSILADTVSININAVNDIPVVYNFVQSTLEDQNLTIFRKDFTDNFTDVDGDTLVHLQFTQLPKNGTLSVNSLDQSSVPFTVQKSFLNGIGYAPNQNFNGNDTIYFKGYDGALYSATSGRIVISVDAVNDAPVNNGFTTSVDEDFVLGFLASDFSAISAFTDLEANSMTDIKITSLPANGTLKLNNTPIQVNNVLSPTQIGNMTFTASANYNGSTYFLYQANDGNLYSNIDSVEIDVVAVNDKPTITVPGVQVVVEDVNSTVTGITIADIDVSGSLLNVSISASQAVISLASNFNLTFISGDGTSDGSMEFQGNLTNVNNAVSSLTYDPNANYNGFDNIQILVSDLGNNGSGGAKADTATIPMQIDGVNDTTIISVPSSKSILESQQLNLDSILLTDIDGNNGNIIVRVSTNYGFLSLSGTALLTFTEGDGTSDSSMSFFGTLAAVNPALSNMKYTSEVGYYGPDAVSIAVTDTAQGSVATDNAQIQIQVTPRAISYTGSPIAQDRCEGKSVSYSVAVEGTPPFNYQWAKDGIDIPNQITASLVLTNLDTSDIANYTCLVTNPAGSLNSSAVALAIYDKPNVNFSWTEACTAIPVRFTDSTVVTGGDTVQSYIWDMGDGAFFGIENPLHTFSSSNPFVVKLIAITNRGCSDTTSKSVGVIPKPITLFSVSEVCVGDTTSFTNSTTTSFGNLTYLWVFGDGDSSTAENVNHYYSNAGTTSATLYAFNDGKCASSQSNTITVNPSPVASFSYNNICIPDDVSFTNTSTIGSGISSYAWDFGDNTVSNNVSPIKSFATADTFDIQLTATSDKGCKDSLTQSIIVYPLPSVIYAAGNVCSIDTVSFSNTSSVQFGGSAYLWNFGDGSNTPLQQPTHFYTNSGSYNTQLTVTGAFGCRDSVSQIVTVYPVATVTANKVDILCNGLANGQINVNTSGGTPNFSYSINNGVTFQSASNFGSLTPGSYNIKTIDGSGCVSDLASNPMIIGQPTQILLGVDSLTEASCFGFNDGFARVTSSGGTPPYLFSIDSVNFQSTSNFTGLAFNSYTITLIDSNNCSSTFDTILGQPTTPISLLVNFKNALCKGDSTGSINLQGSGSVGNYQYSIDGGLTYGTSNAFTSLPVGQYLMAVKDSNGCENLKGVNITEPNQNVALTVTSTQNVNCFGDSSGSIDVKGLGGVGAISYALSTALNYTLFTSFSSLTSGNYTVYAKDFNGCLDSSLVSIAQPASALSIDTLILIDVQCYNTPTGKIEIMASGGTPQYMYSINAGIQQSGNNINVTNSGTYLVLVTDSNNCVVVDTAIINEPTQLMVGNSNVVNESCEDEGNGSVLITGSGGTGAYVYSLDGNIYSTNGQIANLTNGDYSIYVKDANDCIDQNQFSLGSDTLKPVAAFNQFVTGNTVSFYNLSSDVDASWWNFGDGETSDDQSPIYSYGNGAIYNVTLAATNNCGNDTLIKTVDVNSTGIEMLNEASSIEVYPNPANESFVLTINASLYGDVANLSIIDLRGKMVYSERLTDNYSQQFDATNFAVGTYLIKVSGNNLETEQKLIIGL